ATVYSSLEPCARRASRPRPCARRILDAGVRRVVTAWREPDTFVEAADGAGILAGGGARVVVLPELETAAKEPNRHLEAGAREPDRHLEAGAQESDRHPEAGRE
ncbi:hypothetical protein ACH5A0_36640, partial [Kitasatospora sp. NPDC018614]